MASGVLFTFAFVFAFIGGIELLDRTDFALIAFTSKHPPVQSWAGAATAFVLTSALAVAVGGSLEAAFNQQLLWVRVGGGVVLLEYAAYLLLVPEQDRQPPTSRSAFTAAFIMIFLLELGDTTMIFTILFAVEFGALLVVFAASALALACVAGFSCFVGSRLGARVEPRLLEQLVIVILTAAGVLTIIYALYPTLFGGILG
ncbi:MAG: TMEM165/GDT1 family protein [Thermoplasmata archaeon]|nr:TMEM165/GDT1 family protein [Thermoplasmata archaeon]